MVDSVSTGVASTTLRQLPPVTDKGAPTVTSPYNVKVDSIKSLPKLLTLASELANQGPPVDFAKIAQVRQAIALGTYRVSPEQTADAIASFGNGTSK
ncbi:MAG: flagellar biosynthesis anti-sigma factor FlgM [Pseudomonadota bacterium]